MVVDTLRADHVGIYGNPRQPTPNIDALAREGHWFTRAYAQSGWTLPSMTSLLTGLYPHVHRVGRAPFNESAFGRLEHSRVTMAEALKAKGYSTGGFVNNTFMAPEFGLDQGFDTYDYQGATNDQHRTAEDTMVAANAWLSQHKGPVFLLVHVMEPHMDYAPPQATRGTYTGDGVPLVPLPFASPMQIEEKDAGGIPAPAVVEYIRQLYDEEILATDQALSSLFDVLRSRGNWDNTLVVVTSDHGEEFWDHGGFEHGHSLLGFLTRIPLIMAGGLAEQRAPVKSVVQHVDVFHTLLLAAGVGLPPETSGVDLRDTKAIPEQMALSENTLYGPPRLSMVDRDYRLEMNLEEMGGAVYRVLPDGRERRVGGAAQQEQGLRLEGGIRAVRGGLMPVDTVTGPSVPSVEAFQQLKALGYIEGGPEPTDPADPEESETSLPGVANPPGG